jgi:hypothetical protein
MTFAYKLLPGDKDISEITKHHQKRKPGNG